MVVAARGSITNRTALTYSRAISRVLRWSVGVTAADKDAVAADTANRTRGLNIGLTQVWDSGWMVSGNLGGADGLWDQVEFASGSSATSGDQARVDRTESLTLSTQNSNISFFGLTPAYSFTFINQKSNIPRYNVISRNVFIGMVNAF